MVPVESARSARSNRRIAQGRRLLAALLLLAVLPSVHAATQYLSGEATYRERTVPPAGAELVVTLEDVSRADVPAREVAAVRRVITGGPPYAWRIGYDPATVTPARPGSRFVLRARILVGDVLWMTTDQGTPAFGQNPKAPQRLVLSRATPSVAAAPAPPAASAPQAPAPGPNLLGNWNLSHIGEQEVPPNPQRPVAVAHLVFGADGRVTGSDGCNRLSGGYAIEGDRLKFDRLAGTRMACLGLKGRDDAFNRALALVTAWRVQGKSLELLAGGTPVLRFAPGGPN